MASTDPKQPAATFETAKQSILGGPGQPNPVVPGGRPSSPYQPQYPPLGGTFPEQQPYQPGQQYGMPQAYHYMPMNGSTAPPIPPGGVAQNYQASYYSPQPMISAEPLYYLGSLVVDPHMTAAPLGVQKVPGYDPAEDFDKITNASKGKFMKSDKNDATMIQVLSSLSAVKLDALNDYCTAKKGKTLYEIISEKTSGNFSNALCGIALGPLGYDVHLIRQATKGLGTKDTLLTEILLGRPSPEIRLLSAAYRVRHGRNLRDDVVNDLSGNVATLFGMALNAQRPPDSIPVDFPQVTADVEALYQAGQGRPGTKESTFVEILVNRSQPHLAAVISAYGSTYKSLSKVIKSEFNGHLRNALLHIVHGAKSKRDGQGIWRDAKLIEASMAGFGTKDDELIWRIVRSHWDPKRMEAIKSSYRRRYNKALQDRVHGETSGSYRTLLETLIKDSEGKN